MNRKKLHIISGHIAPEFLLLNICIFVVLYFKNAELIVSPIGTSYITDCIQLAVIFNLIWGGIILYNSNQDLYFSNDLWKRIKFLILNTFLFIGIVSTVGILFKIEYFNRTTLLLPIFLFFFVNLVIISLVFEIYKRRKHRSLSSRFLVVGTGGKWQHIADFTKKLQPLGYQSVGILDNKRKPASANGMEVLGKVRDLSAVLDTRKVDEIFINGGSLKNEEIRNIIAEADYRGVRVNLIPDAPIYQNDNFKPASLDGLPVFQYRQSPLDNFNNFLLKRAFDVVFSLAVMILLAPVYFIIGLLVWSDGKGSIFYKPIRKGEAGQTFKCWKFRTMSVCDNPVNGTKSTVKNDPRITKVGKFLRKYDLDELPQFLNVLRGDMSVIGPRPHRAFLQNDFRKIVNDYMVRHYVKPGVSGWAQVNGWRGPTQTHEQKRERIKHDLWYIENWNFWLDLKIIFLTVFGRKTRKNAF